MGERMIKGYSKANDEHYERRRLTSDEVGAVYETNRLLLPKWDAMPATSRRNLVEASKRHMSDNPNSAWGFLHFLREGAE